MPFDFQQWVADNGGFAQTGGGGGGAPQVPQYGGGNNWAQFQNYYNQVAAANQQLQYDDTFSRNNSAFSMSGGTEDKYDGKYRKAGLMDQAAIEVGKWGEFWNNLPGQIAGVFGGDEAKQDWTFDASKFNLSDGFDTNDLNQVKNFGFSLPGMMIGGVFEGLNKGYEAITGTPVQEYREGKDGYEVANYKLDASQRAAAGLDAAINIAGTFTGGAGRVIGGVGKAGAKAALGKTGRELAEMGAKGATQAEKEAVLGAGYKAAAEKLEKAAHRQDLLDGMSKGVVTRALEGGRGGKPLGTAAGLVADMGDEAAEEFVQSYADDVRMKNLDEHSLDRALTGAAWGAAGGALMGAGGRALSHISQINQEDKADGNKPSATDPASTTEPGTLVADDDSLASLRLFGNEGRVYNNRLVEQVQKKDSENRFASGSGVFMQTGTDSNMDLDELDLGVENIAQIFYRDEASRERLAHAFNTDVNTLHDIFRSNNNVAEQLNNLMKASPRGKIQVAVGRNPDTKNGGFYMDIRQFHEGQKFTCHPAVMQLVGSDWDGDRASVYFDPQRLDDDGSDNRGNVLTPYGYVTQMLMNNEGGSNIEWIWAGISEDTSVDVTNLRNKIDEIFRGYNSNFTDPSDPNGDRVVDIREYFVNGILDAVAIKDDTQRDAALSSIFGSLAQTIDAMNTTYSNEVIRDGVKGNGMPGGRRVLNDLLHDVLADSKTVINKQLESYADLSSKRIITQLGYNPNTDEGQEEITNLRNAIYEWQSRGTSGGNDMAFQMTKSVGLLTYLADPNSKYNPIYRQYGGVRYSVNSVPAFDNLLVDLASVNGVEPVVTNILRSAFRLAKPGVDPTVAIETMCDKMVVAEVESRTGLSGNKIRTKEQLRQFQRVFIEVQSKYSRIYNEAHSGLTSQGYQPDPSAAYRNALDGVSKKHGDSYEIEFTRDIDSDTEMNFYRQFTRIYAGVSIGDIFHNTIVEKLGSTDVYGIDQNTPLDDFLESYSKFSITGNEDLLLTPIKDVDMDVYRFLRSTINLYESEVSAIGMNIEKTLSNFDFSGMLARYRKNGNKIDATDVPMLSSFMDLLYEYIGADNAIAMNFILNDEFVDSTVGQMLFSGDPDLMLRVVTSASIYGQFVEKITALQSGDSITQSNAKEDLLDMRTISPIHEMIVDGILDGNDAPFRWFTSVTMKMQDKIDNYNMVMGTKFEKGNYIVNALQTETGRFAISSISAKNRKAQLAKSMMDKQKHENQLKEVNDFLTNINEMNNNGRGSTSVLEEWFADRTRFTTMQYNDDVLAMKILASLTLDNAYVEKATIPEIIAAMYNAAEIGENGGLLSQLNQVTSAWSGKMDKGDWLGNRSHMLMCMSDPNYSCWVWDPDQQQNVLMTQATLFRSAGVDFTEGQAVRAHHIEALLRAYPQTAGYLCSPTTNVVAIEGSLNSQLSRSTSILEDFNEWQRSRGDVGENVDLQTVANVDKVLRDIRSNLFNMPDAHRVITLMIPQDVFEGHVDPRELTREVSKAMDHLSQYTLYRIMSGDSDSDIASANANLISGMAKDLAVDLWQAVSFANEVLAYDSEANLQNSITRIMMTKLVNSAVVQQIAKEQGIAVSVGGIDAADITASIAQDITESVERTMRVCRWLLNDQSETFATIFHDFVGPLVDVNGIATALSQQLGIDQNAAIDAVNQAVQSVPSFNTDFSVKDDTLLSVEDFNDEQALRSKLNDLMSWNPEYQLKGKADNLIDDINGLSGKKKEAAIKSAVDDINKQVIRHELVEISALNHMPINENAVQLRDEAYKSINNLVSAVSNNLHTKDEFAKTLTKDRVEFERELRRRGIDYTVPPRFTYISQTMQSSISNQTASDPAAGNPTKVGVNGSLQKMTFPFSHLPQSLRSEENLDYSFGRTVSLNDIDLYQDVYQQMSAIIEVDGKQQIVGINSQAFKDYVEKTTGLTDVVVFHPEDNPHGLPTYNQRTAAYDPRNAYHRLSGILRRITDFSMEAMVLKTKKLMRTTDHITVQRPIRFASSGRIFKTDFETLEQGFRNYRGEYWNALTNEFNEGGSMSALGFGRDQALIVTQALTPGILLDVSYSDGSVRKVMADASLFLGDGAQDRFEQFVSNMMTSAQKDPDTPQPQGIVGAEVASVSVSEAANRIMGSISRRSNGKKTLKASDAEMAGLEVMADWSDYGAQYEGDVRKLMTQTPPVGYGFNSPIPVTDNPVPPMILMDALSGGGFGNAIKSHQNTTGMRMLVPGSEQDKAAFHYGTILGLVKNDIPVGVVKAWTPGIPQDWDSSPIDRTVRSTLSIIESNNSKYDNVYGGVGIVTDPRKLPEAMNWAKKHGGALYVLDTAISNSFIPPSAIADKDVNIGGAKFVLVRGFNAARYSATRDRLPKSSKRAVQRSSITTTIVVDPNYALPRLLPTGGGDATIMAFSKVWNRAVRTPFNTNEIKMDRLLPDNGKTPKFISKAQATELLSQVSELHNGQLIAKRGEEGDKAFADAGFLLSMPHVADSDKIGKGTMQIKDMIVKYLSDIANGSNRDASDPQPSVARRNEVAALVTDGIHISPVVYPNMPANVEFSWVNIVDDSVVIHYGGTTPMFEDGVEGSQKWEVDGETFKGMVMRAAANVNPSLFCGPNRDKIGVDFAISSETEKSRTGGMDEIMLANTLYYTMKLNDLSLFYKKVQGPDGVSYDYSDAVKQWSPNDIQTLNGRPSERFWNRILSGELRLSLDPEQNKAIRQTISAILQSGKDPRMFFSNYTLQPDTNGVLQRVNFMQTQDASDDWYMELDHKLVLQNIIPNPDKMLRLFNAVDNNLCPNGYDDVRVNDPQQRNQYIVGVDGTSLVDFGDGNLVPAIVRYGRNRILGEVTAENTPNGMASVSGQHVGARAADIGYTDGTVQTGIQSNYLATGHYDEALDNYLRRKQKAMGRKRDSIKYTAPVDMKIATLFPTASRAEINRNKAVVSCLKDTFTHPRVLLKSDGSRMSNEDLINSKSGAALSRLRSFFDPGKEFSLEMVEQLAKCATATSWSDNVDLTEVGDKRVWAIYDNQLSEAIDDIVEGLTSDKHLPVVQKFDDFSNNQGRYSMALLPREIAIWVWNSMPSVREFHGTFENFVAAMKAEQRRCDEAINAIAVNKGSNKSRWIALSDMSRALWLSYGDTSTVLPAIGDVTFPEISNNLDNLASALSISDGWSDEQTALFKALAQESEDKYKYVRQRLENLGYVSKNAYTAGETEVNVAYTRIDEARDITNLLNNAAELSKVMAVINPLLTVGNLLDRGFHQGSTRASIFFGNKLRIGPYKSQKEHIVPANIRKMSVESDAAVELYASLREMEFNSEEVLLISKMINDGNAQEAIEFARQRKAEMTKTFPGKVKEWAYKSASGGNLGLKGQMQNVVDRFVMFAEADGQTFWFEPAGHEFKREDGSPMTRLDAMLASPGGFLNLMTFCLSPNSPSYSIFCQAMNSAKQGDMAQKNAVGLVLNEICRKVPFGNFLMTTCVSRFPMYGINVTGRLANYILPISSMNRAFNEFLAKTELGKRLGVEEVNVHTSMREAMMVDICKLGVGGAAIALFAISGAIQPPDDERKWGNIDEWMVFGTRAGENWFVEDILGMALPLACFWKACEQGKPRFDIITNGIANICYSNPVLRCGDIASFLMNPAESLISDYNEEVMQFQNAKGGPPDFGQYLQSNAFSLGMNWASQFVTPSLVKEWWRASQPLEKSYKRSWETAPSGAITEEGRAGKTEYVTYDEAIKRKLAIHNPVLAFLFSATSGNSYMPADMPDTVYYDDDQLDATMTTSVQGLEGEARIAKVVDLIGVIQSYDNMDELAADGFHVDYETLQAIASQVWDNYHAIDDWYNTLQAEGKLNYYYLGGGDYNEGMRIAGELKLERDNMKQYWYDFYYKKLKDSPIAATMQSYNRYNTTYAADVDGEIYATGIRRSPYNILPITTAPGTTTSPEGTAGYENDFVSVSNVTGNPLSQRALIPSDSGNMELPDFESLSSDGSGNKYSKLHESVYGPSNSIAASTNSDKNNTSGGSGSGSGSRRSGGGGGGGGGGRSGSANIYAPSVNLPKANVGRVMNTDRLVRPDLDYLRPDFETKGSREAYRRSDI